MRRLHWMSRVRCAAVVTVAATIATAAGAQQRSASPVGLWATDGYGFVFDVRSDSVTTWEVTKVSCILDIRAATTAPPAGALGAFRLSDAPVTFTILPGSNPDEVRVHVPFAASDMVMRRISRKPSACDQPTPNTPLSNFDVFAETWAEQYPFFGDKKVSWASVVATNRARVTSTTTPEQLFEIISGMIAPLEDAHSSINATSIGKRFGGVRRSPSFLAQPDREQAYALVSKHLTTPLRSFCQGRVEFGMLAPDIGYLRIRGFSGYTSDGSFESGLAALEAALDTSFATAGSWNGLVIDVRLNNGGADPYGIAIARRLTATSYTAYAKQARSDPSDPSKWTAEQPSIVQPSSRPGFRGPVVELIGVQSISAAETFTQALMNRQPKVTRVGETTQGVFSDVLGRALPNGWRFGLANERFVTNGKSYDHVGIAPDITVESFTPAARATGRDAAVERALALLLTSAPPVQRSAAGAFPRFDRVQLLETTSETSANVSIGDLNGDGTPDVVLAKGRHWPLVDRVMLGDGRGSFAPAYDLGTASDRSYSGRLTDVDRDGDLDVVISNDAPDPKLIYLNDGRGKFAVGSSYGRPEWPTRNATVADLDGDSYPDIVAANRGDSASANYICFNRRGRFDANCTAFSREPATTIAAADFNGDGAIDLAVPHRDGGQSRVYVAGPPGQYSADRVVLFGPPDASIRMSEAADLNGDGLLDLVTIDERAGTAVYLGQRDRRFSAAVPVAGPKPTPYALAVADVNGDHKPDIVVGHIEARPVVYFNDGSGRAFHAAPFGDAKGVAYGFAIADVNGDGLVDIAIARSDAPNVLYFASRSGPTRPK